VTTIVRLLMSAAIVLGVPICSEAQIYPAKPIKIIVPSPGGATTDTLARIIAEKLQEKWTQPVIVDDRGGAGGNIGAEEAIKSVPDGYTILVASSSFQVNPSLYANPPYDPFKDFAPVTLAVDSPNGLFVHPSVPARTVKELIALMQADPGKYPIANSGLGTTPMLASELFKMTFKLDVTTVPYNGGAPVIQALVGNQTPTGFATVPPAYPQLMAGTIRALAMASAKRWGSLPDVPTMAEAGVDNQESDTMQGVFVPAGTPPDIIALLNREIVKALKLPDVQARCREIGFDIVGNTPEEFSAYLRKDIDKWHRVIVDAKIPQIQ